MISTPTRTRVASILAAIVAAFALAPATSAIARPFGNPDSRAKAPAVSYTQSYWGAKSNRPSANHATPVVSYTQSYWGANPGTTPTAYSAPSNGGDGWGTTATAALVFGGIAGTLVGIMVAPARRRRVLPTT